MIDPQYQTKDKIWTNSNAPIQQIHPASKARLPPSVWMPNICIDNYLQRESLMDELGHEVALECTVAHHQYPLKLK